MNLWHLTPDAPKHPERPCPGQVVELWIGTWPIETNQRLHVRYHVLGRDGRYAAHKVEASWDGNAARAVPPHPVTSHTQVYDLYHASWIDEWGSAPGVDLGTWFGEEEENRGWELLAETRENLEVANATPSTHPYVFAALYAAEGSDWFWWFGADQESGYDDVFDDLFRGHLRAVYRGIDLTPPKSLGAHIVPHGVVWTFTNRVPSIQPRDRLIIRTNCPGVLRWSIDGWESVREAPLNKAGGAMAGLHSYSLILDNSRSPHAPWNSPSRAQSAGAVATRRVAPVRSTAC